VGQGDHVVQGDHVGQGDHVDQGDHVGQGDHVDQGDHVVQGTRKGMPLLYTKRLTMLVYRGLPPPWNTAHTS